MRHGAGFSHEMNNDLSMVVSRNTFYVMLQTKWGKKVLKSELL
jgi:hypothetical protein